MPVKISRNMTLPIIALFLLSPLSTVMADDSGETTRQVVLALFEAFNRHDADALVALYSEDAVTRSPGDSEEQSGREGIRENYQGHFDHIPGVWDSVRNMVIDGDQAAIEFIASWNQPTVDDPAARGELRIGSFITVREGRIVRDITYFDRQEFAENFRRAPNE